MEAQHHPADQKIAYLRGILYAPFFTVGMVARVRGEVPVERVKTALGTLRELHPPLASRVVLEADGTAWLTTEGVGEFPLETRDRKSDDDWIGIFLQQEKLPFDLEKGPLIRFHLLRGNDFSDLVVIAPHVVCDGYSMSFATGDLIALLNDPTREIAPSCPTSAPGWGTVRHAALDNLALRGAVRLINLTWPGNREVIHQQEYEQLFRHFWQRRKNGMQQLHLSPPETSALAARCREHGISITSALMAAFQLAMVDARLISSWKPCEVSIPVNIRDRMITPPGKAMGVYVSNINIRSSLRPDIPFWELARQNHHRMHRQLTNSARVFKSLLLDEMLPTIADHWMVALSNGHMSFSQAILARMAGMTEGEIHLTVSNIGRIDLPDLGKLHQLETLIPLPPFPYVNRLLVNTLTVAGRMNIILRYRQDDLDDGMVGRLGEHALKTLLAN